MCNASTTAAGSGCLALGCGRRSRGRRGRLNGNLLLLFAQRLLGGCIPVIHHLRGQHEVQRKPSDKAVQNQLVIHLLECSKDTDEGADQVVENL